MRSAPYDERSRQAAQLLRMMSTLALGRWFFAAMLASVGYINALAELNKSRRRAVASLITERPGDEFADVVVRSYWMEYTPTTHARSRPERAHTSVNGTVVARRSLHRNMSEAVACTVEYFRNHVDCHAARKWNCRVIECMRPCDLHASCPHVIC